MVKGSRVGPANGCSVLVISNRSIAVPLRKLHAFLSRFATYEANSQTQDVLSFNDSYHDASFCIYSPWSVTHVEVERFTRIKFDATNPVLAFCELFPEKCETFSEIAVVEGDLVAPVLRRLIENKELIAQSDNPAQVLGLTSANPISRKYTPDVLSSVKDGIANTFLRHLARSDVNIHFCGHHECHAANAYFSSPYSSALTISLDGGGLDYVPEKDGSISRRYIYGGVYECFGNTCRRIFYLSDFSFGQAWERTTTKLLDLSWGEEGTVMAMAGFGESQRFAKVFAEPHLWLPNEQMIGADLAEELREYLRNVRRLVRNDQDRFDIAAALQSSTERRLEQFLRRFIVGDVRNICLTGGLFLNCQVTGKIREWFPDIKAVFIPPAPYDGGLSIGAAQLIYHGKLEGARELGDGIAPFAMGRRYSRMEILSACRSARVKVRQSSPSEIVDFLQKSKIIGVFCGAAESGRRALGNRSIIADPRAAEMKDRINLHVKHRQWFRPFAPMVLAEYANRWFECAEDFSSPYMSFAVRVRPEVRGKIPAVVHVDGTARVQTVHRDLSPGMYNLLSAWHEATGVPVLLNTSFNDHEPIVESPDQAVNTFRRVQIDGLYFADYEIIALP